MKYIRDLLYVIFSIVIGPLLVSVVSVFLFLSAYYFLVNIINILSPGFQKWSISYYPLIALLGGMVGFIYGLKLAVGELREEYIWVNNKIDVIGTVFTPNFEVISVEVECRGLEDGKIDIRGSLNHIQKKLTKRQTVPSIGDSIQVFDDINCILTSKREETIRSARADVYIAECKVSKVLHDPPIVTSPPMDYNYANILITVEPQHDIEMDNITVTEEWKSSKDLLNRMDI